jgi:hypothetical protein
MLVLQNRGENGREKFPIMLTTPNYHPNQSFPVNMCRESDACSLKGGGGELDYLKTLTYGSTTFSQSKLEHTI